jgi:hypothetical protein
MVAREGYARVSMVPVAYYGITLSEQNQQKDENGSIV